MFRRFAVWLVTIMVLGFVNPASSANAQTDPLEDVAVTGMFGDVEFAAGRFVAVGYTETHDRLYQKVAAYSRDGKQWKVAEFFDPIWRIRWDLEGDPEEVSYDNGLTWEPWHKLTEFDSRGTHGYFPTHVLFARGTFLVGANSSVYKSVSGQEWKEDLAADSILFDRAVYGNGVFVMNSGTVRSTTDLHASWKEIRLGASGSSVVAFGNGKFVIGGRDDLAFISSDGVQWESRRTGLPDLNHKDPRYPVPDDVDRVVFANGQFFAQNRHAEGGTIATSASGLEWTLHKVNNGMPREFVFGNGLYVAVGAVSSDGLHWTPTSPEFMGKFGPYSIAFGNGSFVALGAKGGLYYSADGVTWKRATEVAGEVEPGYDGLAVYIDGDVDWLWGFPQPFIDPAGRILVPLRPLFRKLGVPDEGVKWDEATRTVRVNHAGHVLRVTIGDRIVEVDGVRYELDAPAQVVNDRIFLPIRLVAEALGASVDWDGTAAHIYANTPGDFTDEAFLTAIDASQEHIYCLILAEPSDPKCRTAVRNPLSFTEVTPQLYRQVVLESLAAKVASVELTEQYQEEVARLVARGFTLDTVKYKGVDRLTGIIADPVFAAYTPEQQWQIISGINLKVSEATTAVKAVGFSTEALQYFGMDRLERALAEYQKLTPEQRTRIVTYLNLTAQYALNPCAGVEDSLVSTLAEFAGGFVVGSDSNDTCTEDQQAASRLGDLASSIVVYGDVRDLAKQGLNRARGQEVDDLAVVLSGIGLVGDLGWGNGPMPDPADAVNAALASLKASLKGMPRPVRVAFARAMQDVMRSSDKVTAIVDLAELGKWSAKYPDHVAEIFQGAAKVHDLAIVSEIMKELEPRLLTSHAARRVIGRRITKEEILQALNHGEQFSFYHGGEWKLGYYTSQNGLLISEVDNRITTVIKVKPQYVRNLKEAMP